MQFDFVYFKIYIFLCQKLLHLNIRLNEKNMALCVGYFFSNFIVNAEQVMRNLQRAYCPNKAYFVGESIS